MIPATILTHLRRARVLLEGARPVHRPIAVSEALVECERALAALGDVHLGILDVETEVSVLRAATCYDDLPSFDARGRSFARANRMASAECDRLRVAVRRLERFLAEAA